MKKTAHCAAFFLVPARCLGIAEAGSEERASPRWSENAAVPAKAGIHLHEP
jgi:hypothetical protein